jgi:hypothetical protein
MVLLWLDCRTYSPMPRGQPAPLACDSMSGPPRVPCLRCRYQQDGLYNSLRGLASVLGGRLVGPVIGPIRSLAPDVSLSHGPTPVRACELADYSTLAGALSNRTYTTLCNSCCCLHFILKASAKGSPLIYMSALGTLLHILFRHMRFYHGYQLVDTCNHTYE